MYKYTTKKSAFLKTEFIWKIFEKNIKNYLTNTVICVTI